MRSLRRQAGFSLLLYVLMVMAMGGFLLEGYLQRAREEAETRKELFDRDVLMQAKAALLQYAYNYPVFAGQGPGRLPCADTDNDGLSNTNAVKCVSVGRFPWNEPELAVNELRDASGERLWYAVSGTYATNVLNNSPYVPASSKHAGGKRFVNSDAVGTITIKDQAGQVLYDGAVDGVAAVIIAPGPVIDRNGTLQDRQASNGDDPDDLVADTDPAIVNPVNYLDLNGAQDNATLTHLDSNDGLQLGPVTNANNEIVVNDHIVFITAEEINRMAEKAVLQAYQQALRTYQARIWGTTVVNYRFPWLDDYTTTDLTRFDADVGSVMGRVPSLFAPYYDPSITSATKSVDSELTASVMYNGFPTPEAELAALVSVNFDADADLQITPNITDNSDLVRYYWDEIASPNGWELCPPVTGTVKDCNQALSNPGVPNHALPNNEVAIRVIEVTYSRDLDAGTTFERRFSNRTARPLDYVAPDASSNARVLAEFTDSINDEIDVSFVYDSFYLNSFDTIDSGNLTQYRLGIRYYPSLPDWTLQENDDWHDAVMMVFSPAYQPGTTSPASCTPNNDDGIDDANECLLINGLGGVAYDKAAALVIAGEHDLVDEAGDGFQNDLGDIFEGENAVYPPQLVLDWRAAPAPGNRPDSLLIMDPN